MSLPPDANVRPSIARALRAGSDGALHKPTGFVWLGAALQAGVRHKIVPGEFWALEVTEEDGNAAARVSCPCGAAPLIELAVAPERCECERWFFFDGTSVWALIGPSA